MEGRIEYRVGGGGLQWWDDVSPHRFPLKKDVGVFVRKTESSGLSGH